MPVHKNTDFSGTLLWQSFSSLGKLDRKHLGQWLRSSFFCRREEPFLLFEYLQNCLGKGIVPGYEAAFRYVHQSDGAPDMNTQRLLMSELLAHIGHFLVYREVFASEANFDIHLAAAYRKRGLEKHFRQSLHNARVKWGKQLFRHTEYFDAQAAIEYELYQYLSAGRRTEALNWQQLSDQTDTAYIARKLRQVCMALSHQTVYNAIYQFGLLDTVLDHVRRSEPLQQIPAIGLYFYCYLFLTEPAGETHFQRFKTLLFNSLDQLPVEEQRNLHLLALNFCIRKINQLEEAYFREALDLYQSALKGGLLLENGQLSHFAYNNIVAIALKVGDIDWTETFIHAYNPLLEKKHRDAAMHLNLARMEYARNNLNAALLHLRQADYKDLINNLIAKTLQLKIYYETGEFDALDAHLQSMQTFIRRQRVIGYHKTNYLNIARYGRRLMELNPNSRPARSALRQKIVEEPVLTEKDWFLEMLG